MTHVRQVTGTIHKPDGSPWPEFAIGFDVPKTAATTHATLPGTSVGASTTAHTIVTQTNASGEFSVDLEVDVTIRVTMLGALVTSGTSTLYPGESQFVIVVPDGDTPISLETIRAAEITPPDDPTLPNLVAQVASDLSDHEGDTDNPHEVTAAQVDTYTTSEIDNLIGGVIPEWGNIDGDLADQTDLASALGDKAGATDLTAHTSRQDNPHSVTAAQTGTYTSGEIDNALSGKADTGAVPTELTDLDTSVTGAELDALKQAADGHGDIVTHDAAEFATAAQGELADTAVQPADIADFETTAELNSRDTANRSRANHTGTQAISTVSGLSDALDAKLPTADAPELIRDTMGTALVAGDNITITPDDAGDTITITGAAGGGVAPHPWQRIDQSSQGGAATNTHGMGAISDATLTIAANTLILAAAYIGHAATWRSVQVNVTTPSSAGSLRIALASVASGATSATILHEAGVIDTSSTGNKLIGGTGSPIGYQIPAPGWYWVAMLADEAVTVKSHIPALAFAVASPSVGVTDRRPILSASVPYEALSGSYSGLAPASGSVPNVLVNLI